METLICLAILWLLWLASSKSWRRRFIQPAATLIIAVFVVTSPSFTAFLTWGLTAKIPPDSGERADAIVVLGRGPDLRADRIAEAWQLWRAKRASQIFVSGMMDAIPIVEYLQEYGVSVKHLGGEECSQSTEENALFSSALLRPQGIKDILLVTDSLHMRRSLLVFRSFGFNAIPHPITVSSQTSIGMQPLSMVIREYVGILVYGLMGKFQKRSPEELDHPSPEVMRKISELNCRIPRSNSGL